MERFIRSALLIGEDNIKKLANKKVMIFGCGGVGSYVIEGLARTGVNNFILIDNDTVSISNINRQLIATTQSIGKLKVEVCKERILSINPSANIITYNKFILPETINDIDFSNVDFVIDCIDTISGKLAIIEKAIKNNVNIISSMGTGSKLNPLELKVVDIYKTKGCPLAKVMRSELKKRNIKSLKVCYSEEDVKQCMIENPPKRASGRPTPSSISFVPSCAGLIIASEVVKDIIGIKE